MAKFIDEDRSITRILSINLGSNITYDVYCIPLSIMLDWLSYENILIDIGAVVDGLRI